MSWPEVRLDEVVEIGRGSSPRPIKDERYFINGNIPWVKIADATVSGKTIYKTNQYVNEFGASFSRHLKKDSVILSASGVSLGIPRILGVDACIHDGWLYFSNFNGIDSGWLYYRLILLKDYFLGIANGAAIQNINTEMLRETKIGLPDIDVQKKIASILSNYDDLIQTNQQRIVLLEEAAQRLYDEWFVKLRFPNHEQVPVVDGVPEGWERVDLSEIAYINKKSIKKDEFQSIRYIDISSVGERKIDSYFDVLIADAAGRAKRKVTHGDIIWSCVRPNRRQYALMWQPLDNVIVSTGFCTLTAKGVTFVYLYLLTTDKNFSDYLENVATGAAYPAVTASDFESYQTLKPTNDILDRFNLLTLPLIEQAETLKIMSQKLAQARDALLPRLMSGKMDVSGLSLKEIA